MMRRDEAIRRLKRGRRRLADLGVGRLFLYGSVARDQAAAGSDVDLLVDPADPAFSIFTLARVQQTCADLLGAPADVHDYDGYVRLAEFNRRVTPDLIRVF
ncbi:nucleotidyltransferase domain-containing protein [Phenylobacterium sp.]|uniref:nucleotidyltransferase family protein n=1 Tax=Phenylobacterium sp. TaxID=1871053 RepID=UPI0025D9E8D5|nr:nucleotidyltransferase domain-containing protein [Phenylobacterium sp.]MBX3483254.1 nucleotidyltransferase domain-containing protein [Phenylobacterium sp.]